MRQADNVLTGRHKPPVSHDGSEKPEKTFPLLQHVLLGKFDADGKDANSEDDARNFKGDRVGDVVIV